MSDSWWRRSPLTVVGVLVSLAVFAALATRFAWLCDDAFISFRYADHWAQGSGLRYNPGESPPVEGYSNFLWVALGALVERLGGEQTVVMPWLSAAAGGALIVVLAWSLRRGAGLSDAASALAVTTLAAAVPFAVWATGGLETMAFAALFFLVFALVTLAPDGVPVAAAGVAGLALALMRIEGTFWAVGLGALGWIVRRARGEREGWAVVGYLVVVAAGAWAWWIARYLYYGDPWPNTVYVKVGFSGETLAAGGRYLATFALTWLTPFFVVLALPVVLGRERRPVGLATLGCWLALWGYAAAVGGDFMAMGRLLVPALPFQALLFGLTLGVLGERRGLRWTMPLVAAAHVVLGLLPVLGHDLVPRATLERLHFRGNTERYRSEVEQWAYMRANTAERTVLARLLAEATAPGESLVRGAIGVVGYYTELDILDTFGLVSPEVSHREGFSEDRSPGHAKKVDPEFFLDREPTYLVARAFPIPAEGPGRAGLARQLRRLGKKWREEFEGQPYGPVVTEHEDPTGSGDPWLLVRVARFSPDEMAGFAWTAYDSFLAEL